MAVSATLQKFLKSKASAWEKARENRPGSYDNPPDGKYTTRLTGATINESKNSGRVQIVFTYLVVDGDEAGRDLKSFHGIEDEQQMEWAASHCYRLGLDISDVPLVKLPENLAELEAFAPYVKLTLKTKGEYQNIYVDKSWDAEGEPIPVFGEPEPEKKAPKATKEAKAETVEETEEAAEEVEEVESEDDTSAIAVGMLVDFEYKGEILSGNITEIDEEEQKCKIKSGSRIYPVKADKIILEDNARDE